ncbi:MAG: hypothetical protein AAF290_00640 [Pseudomonadota bacterium]
MRYQHLAVFLLRLTGFALVFVGIGQLLLLTISWLMPGGLVSVLAVMTALRLVVPGVVLLLIAKPVGRWLGRGLGEPG